VPWATNREFLTRSQTWQVRVARDAGVAAGQGAQRWYGPALLQPGPPRANKKPPGPSMLNHNLLSGPCPVIYRNLKSKVTTLKFSKTYSSAASSVTPTHAGTDLRIGHGLGSRATILSMTTQCYLKFAKLRRGITWQFTLKRAEMQMSGLL